jgi:hypothetical protein
MSRVRQWPDSIRSRPFLSSKFTTGTGVLLAQGPEAVKWLDVAMRRANLTSD